MTQKRSDEGHTIEPDFRVEYENKCKELEVARMRSRELENLLRQMESIFAGYEKQMNEAESLVMSGNGMAAGFVIANVASSVKGNKAALEGITKEWKKE